MSRLRKITSAGFTIHMFDAEALVASLDDSGDLPRGKGMEYFNDLLIEKYMDLDPLLEDDLNRLGIESPILVEVDGGSWIMMDGHHRLAWAVIQDAPVPVVLVDTVVDIFALDELIRENEEDFDLRS